ncbi:FAD-binding domain-containing protein [Westerdykella ornata]|uniref:FAD-binding domain-containing protein n=1 Tax=Westerdykella ornata TaxID=318751 RepID=A0A6A6J9Y6_WESOR|nr:FAD-binding domain-containing protein [Westerdykella ornata]KAF2272019.1 FAD-binding domain-containing protein [Westerdykella ornata]
MKTLVTLTASALLASIAFAATVSPDGTCGGANGYTCLNSAFGNCCSQYGWCGSTTGHCGTGCNPAFGTCTNNPPPSSTVRSSSTPQPTPTKRVSTDGSCAGTNGYTCLGSTFGNCCSQWGWCGSTVDHCGTGCNSAFGSCTGNGGTTTSTTSTSPTPTPSGSVLQCLNTRNVPYKMTSDAGWADLIEPYNLRLPHTPAVVVLPSTNQHVQDAVVCAKQAGIKVQAKGGGHSYANFASGGKDGSMMIVLEAFNGIQLDASGVVKVGGGVRLGNLADGIWTQGQKALSHGTCPGVGIGGHATHGGYGHTSRNWGLAMDAIVKVDVVLANGTLVTASSTQNSEIFWGIRGAADSLGIVTSFYLQTRSAPSSITYFEIQFDGIFNSKATFTNTLLHLQDFARNASVVDNRISFGIYMDGYGSFAPSGAFFGSVSEFNTKIRPEFLRGLPTPTNVIVQSYSWYDYLVKVSGKNTIKVPLTGYDEHENFFAKSITVPESDGLTATSLNSLYDYIKRGTSVDYFIIINLYGGPGSAINSKDTNFAAYSDRHSLWVMQNYGFTANSITWINGLNDAVVKAQPQTQFGAYLNYVDPSLDAATAHKVYYGDAVYARLLALKKSIDPQSVFWNPQAIGA